MGFVTLRADLADPATHRPDSGAAPRGRARGGECRGSADRERQRLAAVHEAAPRAVYAAREAGAPALLVSAVGIAADTPFAPLAPPRRGGGRGGGRHHPAPRPRDGRYPYGGTSLAGARRPCHGVMPVVGRGSQRFNPIHAEDLAAVIAAFSRHPPSRRPRDRRTGADHSRKGCSRSCGGWLGCRPRGFCNLAAARGHGAGVGRRCAADGAVSRTHGGALAEGSRPDETALLARIAPRPRPGLGLRDAAARGTQDLWHARLYLVRSLLRWCWRCCGSPRPSGACSCRRNLPARSPAGSLPDAAAIALARVGRLADLALGAAFCATGGRS